MPKSVFVQDTITVQIAESSLWPAFEVDLKPLNREEYGKVQAQLARVPADMVYAEVFGPMVERQVRSWTLEEPANPLNFARLHPALIDRLANILLNGYGGILKN